MEGKERGKGLGITFVIVVDLHRSCGSRCMPSWRCQPVHCRVDTCRYIRGGVEEKHCQQILLTPGLIQMQTSH